MIRKTPTRMEKILIVNQNSGYLTIDVANAFAEQYDVVVVMFGLNRKTDRGFNPKIKIQKTIKYNRSSFYKRIFTWGICLVHLLFLLLFKYRNYSVLYYTNPPVSYFASLLFPNKFSVVIFDAYPNALKLIGIEESSAIYRFWKAINKAVFRKAIRIITLSEGMKKQLAEYVDKQKIRVVPVWPASESFRPIPKEENVFLRKMQLENKFIVLYSGNMGIGHNMEILIDMAESLTVNNEIHFIFIGEGTKKRKLEDAVNQKGLKNVSFFTWQPPDVLPFSLACADLSFVSLEKGVTNVSVPSKTFNYMAVGSPLLGVGDKGSELELLIQKYDNGKYFNSQSVAEIAGFIADLFRNNNKLQYYRTNSLRAAKEHTFNLSHEYLF